MEHRDEISLVLRTMSRMWVHGSWCGETHIQKNMFFLQELVGIPFQWSFVLYKYGPFSFDLSYLIGEIHGYSLVKLVPQWGFRPKIQVTELGKEFYQDHDEAHSKFDKGIEFVTKELGAKNVDELEQLSTGLHVSLDDTYKNQTVQARSKRLNELKPHIQLPDASFAIEQVDELNLRAGAALSE